MQNSEIPTVITVGELWGKQTVPNITLEDAKFWGRPNFKGEMDRFKDARRKFNVLIKNEEADALRELGYPVKTLMPTEERLRENPDEEPLSFLKIMVDDIVSQVQPDGQEIFTNGPNVTIIRGEEHIRLNQGTVGIIDDARIVRLDMEIRAWNYNADEVREGLEEPRYSARLVTLVAVSPVSILGNRYGNIV